MVKISEGPILIAVASGKEIMASGEWGILIPLADGSFQTVRGLRMKKTVRLQVEARAGRGEETSSKQ